MLEAVHISWCTQQLEENCVTFWRCVCRIQCIVSSSVILCIYHDSRRLCHSLFWKYIKAVFTLTADAVIVPSLKCARSFFLIPQFYALSNANIALLQRKGSNRCTASVRFGASAQRLGLGARVVHAGGGGRQDVRWHPPTGDRRFGGRTDATLPVLHHKRRRPLRNHQPRFAPAANVTYDVTCHVTVAVISILFWFGLIDSLAWSLYYWVCSIERSKLAFCKSSFYATLCSIALQAAYTLL